MLGSHKGPRNTCSTDIAPKTVDTLHAEWTPQELTIAQAPVALDFGYTFVALDPDGHRLRVFAPSDQ